MRRQGSRFLGGAAAGFLALSAGCGGGGGAGAGTIPSPVPAGLREGPSLAGAIGFEVSDQYLVRGLPQGARSVECRIPLPVVSRGCTVSRPVISCPARHEVRGPLAGAPCVTIAIRDPGVSELTVTLRYACESHAVAIARGPAAALTSAERSALRPYLAAGEREGVTAGIRARARQAMGENAGLASLAGALLTHADDEIAERSGAGAPGVFFSLCRAAGIPSRIQRGVRLAREGSAPNTWVEFYLGGIGWVPVDLSRPAADPTAGLGGIPAGYVPYSGETFSVTVDGAPHADWRRGVSAR